MTDTFGKTLRRLRLDAQVGLRELSRLVDKSPGYISDVEQDNVAPPSEEVIVRIAEALRADKNELLSAASKLDPELVEVCGKRTASRRFFEAGQGEGLRQRGLEKARPVG